MNVNPILHPHSTGPQAKSAANAVSDAGSLFSQALTQCREEANESEDVSSMKDFCDKVFLPDWLERLKKLDEMREEDETLEALYAYVDALVDQSKEENRAKMREEQLESWFSRLN
ncbi:MAG: hypothetical protein HFF18_04790 [Oscillospiraceae bacterium]|nr:hypothetical protein [Oscillospiraceae bacterium]